MLLMAVMICGIAVVFWRVNVLTSVNDWQLAYPDHFPLGEIYDLKQLQDAERNGTGRWTKSLTCRSQWCMPTSRRWTSHG
jgi:hypothetical protein